MHILSESTGKGVFYDWNFNSTFIGSPDECAGRLQHAGDKGDQPLGFDQFCAVISQLIIAYVIELLGWFGVEKQPLTMRKVAGMAIAIIGVVIFEK